VKQYKVTGKHIQLSDGLVQLEPKQAEKRGFALDPAGNGVYVIRQPIHLFEGELFGHDGDLSFTSGVEAVDSEKPDKTITEGVAVWPGTDKVSDDRPIVDGVLQPLEGHAFYRVVRAFKLDGQPMEPDTVIELPTDHPDLAKRLASGTLELVTIDCVQDDDDTSSPPTGDGQPANPKDGQE
jgi:hypothetical protein